MSICALGPHCQGFFWDVLPHKKGPKKAFTHKKGPKKAFGHLRPMGPSQVGAHTGTHTSDKGLFQKGLKKAWPENDTPAPPTAKVFFGRPTTQKGSKKSLRTQKGSKKSLRHWRPMRPSQMGTQTSDKGLFQKGLTKNLTRKRNTCPPTAKVFFGTSYHTKRVQKKPSDI